MYHLMIYSTHFIYSYMVSDKLADIRNRRTCGQFNIEEKKELFFI